MGDPIRRLERELRNAVIEAIRERKSFDEIQSEIARRITAAGIEKNLGEQLHGTAVRTAQWINDRTLSTTEQRRVASVLATSENHFAKIGGKIQRGIVDDVRRLIASDRPSSEIESVIAHRLRSTQRQAATITQTALAGFDRLTTLHQAPTATHLRYVGPPAQRDFCRDRVGRVFSLEEISSMDNGQGLTVLTYCGGYNCRHTWEPAAAPKAKTPPPSSDPLTAKFFTNEDIEIGHSDVVAYKAMSKHVFGRTLSDVELSRICGSPNGGKLTSSVIPPGYVRPVPVLRIRIEHPMYKEPSYRDFFINRYGRPELHNALLKVLDDAPKGFGTRIFSTQVAMARKLGIPYITTNAAGNRDSEYKGYFVWPRLGYNAYLSDDEIETLPDFLEGALTVIDVMATKQGRDWWLFHGEGRNMVFELHDDSLSMRKLSAYLNENGVEIEL